MPYLWIVILIILVAAAAFFATPRIKEWRESRQREQIEDALKHMLDREQQGRHASPESLAGALSLSGSKNMQLSERMEAQGLIETQGTQVCLTREGERLALQIVRAHRLWERYLADEARMPLEKVHSEAHRREHTMSKAEIDALDAALGYPTRDPHGDPIPNREGKIVQAEGMPLTAWQAEGAARIVHIEDEPAIAYAQITAEGLKLGQDIRILQKSPERYILTDGENEYRLAPAVAANLTVMPIPASEQARFGAMALVDLRDSQKAEILGLDESVQGFTRRRFLDLGLTPGTLVYPELQNFFGDPRAYRVRGTLIALRKDQAAKIYVKALDS